MYTLTKRERSLIYFMLLIAILVGMVYLLIIPASGASSTYSEELAFQSTEKNIMERSISIKEEVSSQARADYAAILELVKNYYEPMTNDELDSLLTGLLFLHHVTPVSLSIDKKAEYIDPSGASVQTVSIVAHGTLADSLALLDVLKEDPALKVVSLTLQNTSGGPGETASTLSFSVEVYSYDKALLPSIE